MQKYKIYRKTILFCSSFSLLYLNSIFVPNHLWTEHGQKKSCATLTARCRKVAHDGGLFTLC